MADNDFPLLSIIELRTELMNRQRELKKELLKTEHLITGLNDLMDYHKEIAGCSFAQWKEGQNRKKNKSHDD